MKNSVTEREVIDALRNCGAMAVEELANNIDAFKHMVFPVISTLIKQGYVQKKDTGNGAPVFELSAKTFEISQEPTVSPAKPAAPKAVEVAKPSVTLLETAKKPSAEQTQDSPRPAAARLSVVKPTQPAPSTQPATRAVANELNLLAFLAAHPRQKSTIEEVFGNCEELIGELTDKQLIESLYVIDAYVFNLNTEKAYSLYPDLSSQEKVDEILNGLASQPTAEESVVAAPTVEVPAPAPVEVPAPATASAQPVPSMEEAALEEPALEERQVVRDEFDQSEEIMLPGDAMKEISRLVQRLVQDELKKEREKMGAGLDVEAVSGKIKKAAVSLRDAAKALEETLAILAK